MGANPFAWVGENARGLLGMDNMDLAGLNVDPQKKCGAQRGSIGKEGLTMKCQCVAAGLAFALALFAVSQGFADHEGKPTSKDRLSQLGITDTLLNCNIIVPYKLPEGEEVKEPAPGPMLKPFLRGKPISLTFPDGFLLRIREGSPLHKAGFRTGDVLTRVDKLVTSIMAEDLKDYVTKRLNEKRPINFVIFHFDERFWHPDQDNDDRTSGKALEPPWGSHKEILLLPMQ